MQEPSFYAIPGLRHEGKCKLHLIIGTFCTSDYENQGSVKHLVYMGVTKEDARHYSIVKLNEVKTINVQFQLI